MKIIKSEHVKLVSNPKIGSSGFQKADFTKESGMDTTIPIEATEIERLREMAARQWAEREDAAFERGREAGRREAEERYCLNAQKNMEALKVIVDRLAATRREIIAAAETDLLTLALAMAEKVIHHEIAVNREVVYHVLRAALKEIVDHDNLVIRLHPDDYLHITTSRGNLLKEYEGMKNVTFQEDPSVGRGGVIVETTFGEVDARIDQQFREIRNALISGR